MYISHLWISYGDPQISQWFGAQNPWWKSPGPFLDLKDLPGCLDENFFQRNDGVAGVTPWRCWDNFHNESCFLVDFGVFLRGGCWVVGYTRQMLGKKESWLKYANLWVKWADRTKGRVNWAGRTETSWVNFNKNKHVVKKPSWKIELYWVLRGTNMSKQILRRTHTPTQWQTKLARDKGDFSNPEREPNSKKLNRTLRVLGRCGGCFDLDWTVFLDWFRLSWSIWDSIL